MAHKPFAKIKDADERGFVVEQAAQTLMEAERIRSDKPLMKAVKPKLAEISKAASKAKTS